MWTEDALQLMVLRPHLKSLLTEGMHVMVPGMVLVEKPFTVVSAGQECPHNRRKNECGDRRFGRQQTQRVRRRQRRRCQFQEASASLLGGFPPHTVLSRRSDEGHLM